MIIPGSNSLIHLSIPIIGGREVKVLYKDVKIDHSSNWKRDHLRSIKSVYGKSPWGIHYFDSLEGLFQREEIFLYDWNLLCFDWLCHKMKVQFQIVDTINFFDEVVDLTDRILPTTFLLDSFAKIQYSQVFEDRLGFQSNMSGLDLLMNEGPVSTSKFLL